jgi:hypothetical protein
VTPPPTEESRAAEDAASPQPGISCNVSPETTSRPAFILVSTTVLSAALLLAGSPARAVDGRVDVRGTSQDGRAGAESYETSTLRVDTALDQHLDLGGGLFLRLHFGSLREETDSRGATFGSDFTTTTQSPTFTLSYGRRAVRVGLSGSGFRKRYTGTGFSGREDERFDLGFWMRGSPDWGRWYVRLQEAGTWRRDDLAPDRASRDRLLGGGTRADLAGVGRLSYDLSRNETRIETADTRTTFTRHALQLQRDGVIVDDRLRYSLDARSNFMIQDVTADISGGRELLLPVAAGYTLDDTPEILDPLEPAPIPLPGLVDGDRTGPTSLDLGDDASVVREYGGDYRNLVLDFGDDAGIGAAVLYVDRRISFPDFLRWRLFVSDDPEGSIWSEIGSDAFSAVYREWDTGRQGWVFEVAPTATTRRLKLVDVKLGPTEPTILVTELEVYGPAEGPAVPDRNTVARHRLTGMMEYDLRRDLTLRYDGDLNERRSSDDARDLSGTSHTVGARWRPGPWYVQGALERHRLNSPTRQNTDTRGISASVARDLGRSVWSRLSWSRTEDDSRQLDKTTDHLTLDASWRIAPALRLTQQISRGRLEDRSYDLDSRSWTLATNLFSSPRPSLNIDLRRVDRWVDQEAGTGFSRFNDTEGSVRWAILPLLTVSSQIRYELRDEGDWLTRHLLSWTPLPGGSMELRVNLSHYRDTRSDTRLSGLGTVATWSARPRLRLEGGLEWQDYERRGARSRPFNTHFRANWSF